ncbi:MAG: sarcosine oxidase subunit gamma family protein [Ascidiaceihabitans sp.]|nr:sarcosine oxidase subunit gamma family protein [Ascidiaceihabitans sp.]
MVDLIAKTPMDGFVPLTLGNVTLSEMAAGPVTSISPFNDTGKDLSAALKTAHGMTVPAANRSTAKASARAIWFGREQFILMGCEADQGLANYAALTDQSDGWTVVTLKGAGAADVLARVTPLDLRSHVFKKGHTARSDLMHMASSITRTGDDTFMIMVFRSMAGTLLHDLQRAMEGLASRG